MFVFNKGKTAPASKYAYKRLPKNYIRVLELDQGRGRDILQGRLVVEPFGTSQTPSSQATAFPSIRASLIV